MFQIKTQSAQEQSKKKVIELIQKHLYLWPTDSVDLLDAVSQGLKLYQEGINAQRNELAYNAIDDLWCLLLPSQSPTKKIIFHTFNKKQKCIYLMNSIAYNFPKGWDSVGSNIQKKILTKFCNWYFDYSNLYQSYWETEVRGVGALMTLLKSQWEERR